MKFNKQTKILFITCLFSCLLSLRHATELKESMSLFSNFGMSVLKGRSRHKSRSHKDYTDTQIRSDSGLGQSTSLMDGLVGSEPEEVKIGSGPVFWKGWIKYIKYADEAQGAVPNNFFINNEFFEQKKSGVIVDAKSTDANMIKEQTLFYGLLFKSNFNIIKSPKSRLTTTFDTLSIDQLHDVWEAPGFRGKDVGIEDLGNFTEGFCFRLKGYTENFIICAQSDAEKKSLMLALKNLKIASQREHGNFMIPEHKELGPEGDNKSDPNFGDLASMKDGGSLKTGNLLDGYWIFIQDWSECSLTCGGGVQTIQRMCVPHKPGGKPCEGEKILTKPCHTQPCPSTRSIVEREAKTSSEIFSNSTQVKILPFSSRKQQYIKCVIKESDMMYTQSFDSTTQNNPYLTAPPNSKVKKVQIPSRVVMNNETISAFSGDTYDSLLITYELAKSVFAKSSNPGCFIIASANKTSELCPFGFGNNGDAYEEWKYDFNQFKYQCNTERSKADVDLKAILTKELNEKIKAAKQEIMVEQQAKIKHKYQQSEVDNLKKQEKATNQIVLKAIEKELDVESMLLNEEYEREQFQQQEALKKIDEEKRKSDCLMTAIKQKKMEDQLNIRKEEEKHQIEEIKQQAVQTVSIRRSNLKKKLSDLRQRSSLEEDKLNQSLAVVRSTMNETIQSSYKKGNPNQCSKSATDAQRKNYCSANFDDVIEFNQCNSGDFCTKCCHNEFGTFYESEIPKCIADHCADAPVPPPTDGNGRWIWQSSVEAKQ